MRYVLAVTLFGAVAVFVAAPFASAEDESSELEDLVPVAVDVSYDPEADPTYVATETWYDEDGFKEPERELAHADAHAARVDPFAPMGGQVSVRWYGADGRELHPVEPEDFGDVRRIEVYVDVETDGSPDPDGNGPDQVVFLSTMQLSG
ncbi:MAG TPA: hypothetical protein VI997_03300 [Candidatus Thermoplasmatota archaeon]|nr:hypothetical protein [Candidatus Thermoplasmatota archaeon]